MTDTNFIGMINGRLALALAKLDGWRDFAVYMTDEEVRNWRDVATLCNRIVIADRAGADRLEVMTLTDQMYKATDAAIAAGRI
jgi:hypothetical protein